MTLIRSACPCNYVELTGTISTLLGRVDSENEVVTFFPAPSIQHIQVRARHIFKSESYDF